MFSLVNAYEIYRVAEFSKLVGTDVVGRPGGAVSLAVGMASILSGIPGLRIESIF